MPYRGLSVRAFAAVLAAVSLALPQARADDPTRRGFDADPSRPALSLDGGFAVETAVVAPARAWQGALLLDYATGLLALRLGGERDQLIRSRLTANLLYGRSFGRAEVGIDLPLVLHQRADFSLLRDRGVTGPMVSSVDAAALGDLRLFGKVSLLSQGEAPLGLAALLDVRLPTGNQDAFAGDGLSAIPGLVATRTLGPVRLDAQAGYLFRRQGQYAQLVVHDGLTYAAGASLALPGAGPVARARAMAELLGGWPRGDDGSSERYRAPLSVRGGVRAWLGCALSVEAGAGTGLGQVGYGREAWRIFTGVRYTGGVCPEPEPKPEPAATETARDLGADPDGDGVLGDKDLCPLVPGSADMDGCPDRDGDFIPDPEDKCPDDPGPASNDGCPVPPGPVVEIETERLSLKDSIHFDTAKDTIKPESDHVLDAIATLVRDHPELKRIRVEGHTDNVGADAYNKDLSRRRARSVVAALVKRGIAADRLFGEGYGFDRPVAPNTTALGRAKNRRVEFTIMDEQP